MNPGSRWGFRFGLALVGLASCNDKVDEPAAGPPAPAAATASASARGDTTAANSAAPPPDPALERNPDTIDLSTWQRVSGLPETCAVYVAQSPGETFRPLPFRPCADRPGCSELAPSWGTETSDVVTLQDAAPGYTHFSALRGQHDALPRRALHVIETRDEKAVFAVLSRSTDGRCSVDVTTSAQGIAIGVIDGGIAMDHVRFATATWQAPTKPKWIAIHAGDLAKLRGPESYPRLAAFADEGIWLGADYSFSRLDPLTGRIAIAKYAPGLGAIAGSHVPVRGGAIAVLHTEGQTHHDGLAFFDPKLQLEVILPLREGVAVEKLAVDRANGEELFWIETKKGAGCELFRAPVATRAADFQPRSVSKLPRSCSLLKGKMLVGHGLAVHEAGEPVVTDPGELQIVEVESGKGWRLPSPNGRVWVGPTAITQDAIWASSKERSVRVGDDWSFGARPAIVRLERASLGPAQPLR